MRLSPAAQARIRGLRHRVSASAQEQDYADHLKTVAANWSRFLAETDDRATRAQPAPPTGPTQSTAPPHHDHGWWRMQDAGGAAGR